MTHYHAIFEIYNDMDFKAKFEAFIRFDRFDHHVENIEVTEFIHKKMDSIIKDFKLEIEDPKLRQLLVDEVKHSKFVITLITKLKEEKEEEDEEKCRSHMGS